MSNRPSFQEFKSKALQNPKVKEEYEALHLIFEPENERIWMAQCDSRAENLGGLIDKVVAYELEQLKAM
jgi:hypothetical protein